MLAASSDGGGIAADPPAARPVLAIPASVLLRSNPPLEKIRRIVTLLNTAHCAVYRCPPAFAPDTSVLKSGSTQYAGWLCANQASSPTRDCNSAKGLEIIWIAESSLPGPDSGDESIAQASKKASPLCL
jgi:hypothetical protein